MRRAAVRPLGGRSVRRAAVCGSCRQLAGTNEGLSGRECVVEVEEVGIVKRERGREVVARECEIVCAVEVEEVGIAKAEREGTHRSRVCESVCSGGGGGGNGQETDEDKLSLV